MPPIDLQQPDERPETRIVAAGIGMDLVEKGHGAPCPLLHGIDGVHPPSRRRRPRGAGRGLRSLTGRSSSIMFYVMNNSPTGP